MHARTLAAAAALASLLAPAAPALADEVGDVSAAGDAAALALFRSGGGPDGGGFVASLDAREARPHVLSPAGEATSLPDVSAVSERHVVVAWRAGRFVQPAQAPLPPAQGVFSGRLDPLDTPIGGQVSGGLRAHAVPERVHVAARPDGSHVLVWVDPGDGGTMALAVSASGTPGEVRRIGGRSVGPPLVTTSRRHVWVALAESSGTLFVLRLSRGASVVDDYNIEPEGRDGGFRAIDIAPDGTGGVVVTSVRESRGRRVLAFSYATTGLTYTQDVARAGRSHDFGAQAGVAGGRALIVFDDARGGTRAVLGPRRGDRLGPITGPVRLGARERVEDVATDDRGRVRVLVNGRRGMALRALTARRGRIGVGRPVDLSRSSRGQRDGRLALGGGGRAFFAWEQVVRDDCVEVVAGTARGRRARSAALTDC